MKLVVIECTAEELKATRTLSDSLAYALSNAFACVGKSKDDCKDDCEDEEADE